MSIDTGKFVWQPQHGGVARIDAFWRCLILLAAFVAAATAPSQSAHAYQLKVLHSFCARVCLDGRNPYAGVIMDGLGNLYGTTGGGGSNNSGTVFELQPSATSGKWTEKVLYNVGGSSFLINTGVIIDGIGQPLWHKLRHLWRGCGIRAK